MHTRLNVIYNDMKLRCFNPRSNNFHLYGGRGITICPEWLDKGRSGIKNYTKGYLAFKEWSLSNGYNDNLTLDRIDSNKDYYPENCRWVSPKIQSNNIRTNVRLTYNGQTKTLAQWADLLGINYHTLYSRIYQYHWSVPEAFESD